MRVCLSAIAIAFLLAGCVGTAPNQGPGDSETDPGGDDDGTDDDRPGDDEVPGDDDPGDDDPPPTGQCPNGELGALESLTEAGAVKRAADPEQPDGDQVYAVFGKANENQAVELGLWDGYGAFAGGSAATGTYPITGAEASAIDCGVCLLFANLDPERVYIATSGSVTVDSLVGNMVARATNVVFSEIDTANGEILAGGCTASASSVNFSAAIEQQ